MRSHLKKTLLSVIAVFAAILVFGQEDNRFYASVEDYKNNKPIGGYSIEPGSWQMLVGNETLKITTASGTEKKDVSKLPSEYFSYENTLHRIYKGRCHIVMVEGPLCYYALRVDNASRYYSETITGEMKKFKEKTFKKMLDQHGLGKKFEKDKPKREMKDTVNGYFNKQISWHIKYFHLLNEKLKG